MTKFKTDRRCGVERREFQYTEYFPERRSGIDQRCAKNGKEIIWIKYKDKKSKEKQHGNVCINITTVFALLKPLIPRTYRQN